MTRSVLMGGGQSILAHVVEPVARATPRAGEPLAAVDGESANFSVLARGWRWAPLVTYPAQDVLFGLENRLAGARSGSAVRGLLGRRRPCGEAWLRRNGWCEPG